jgi:hypothetical protein
MSHVKKSSFEAVLSDFKSNSSLDSLLALDELRERWKAMFWKGVVARYKPVVSDSIWRQPTRQSLILYLVKA